MLRWQVSTHPECSACPDISGTLLSDGIQLSSGVTGCMALLGSGPAFMPIKNGQAVAQSPWPVSIGFFWSCQQYCPNQLSGPLCQPVH